MIVLNKKRIKIIVTCIFISIFAFSFKIGTVNEKEKNTEKTITTTSTPVSGKTVVLDAGHGIPEKRSYLLTQRTKGAWLKFFDLLDYLYALSLFARENSERIFCGMCLCCIGKIDFYYTTQ